MVTYVFKKTPRGKKYTGKRLPRSVTTRKETLNSRIKRVALNISETKYYDHYETVNVYSYDGSHKINLFDPGSEGAGDTQVVGEEAFLDKTYIKMTLGRGSNQVATTWRVLVFYWHDVSNEPTYDEIIKIPGSTDNALFPLSNIVETKKKRFTLLKDMSYIVDSYESRIHKTMYIDHRKRKVYAEDENWNPRVFIMFLNNAPDTAQGALHVVSRTTYKDM